jgi:hypothetical protein
MIFSTRIEAYLAKFALNNPYPVIGYFCHPANPGDTQREYDLLNYYGQKGSFLSIGLIIQTI